MMDLQRVLDWDEFQDYDNLARVVGFTLELMASLEVRVRLLRSPHGKA